MIRILITGSRLWRYPATIRRVLDETVNAHITHDTCPNVTVVHGGAAGADRIAGDYAEQSGWNVEVHHADWATCDSTCSRSERHRRVGKRGEYCPTAGHRRNAFMVSLGADLVLAFWRDHSGGTGNCLDLAKQAGLLIDLYADCACHPVGQPVTL